VREIHRLRALPPSPEESASESGGRGGRSDRVGQDQQPWRRRGPPRGDDGMLESVIRKVLVSYMYVAVWTFLSSSTTSTFSTPIQYHIGIMMC
jgi:hypothetical protein